MVRTVALAAVLLAGLWAGVPGGPARPGAVRAETSFARMDADGDGFVSRDEFLAARPEAPDGSFETLDADGDGRLAPGEWADGCALFAPGQDGICRDGGSGCGSGRGLDRKAGRNAGTDR